MMTLNIVAS